MTRQVAVLGAAGFIGRHLVQRLSSLGFGVIAATRTAPLPPIQGAESLVSAYDRPEDFKLLMDRCDAIIHAASSTTPGSSKARREISGDLGTTLALIEAMQVNSDIRLIYLSSGGNLYGDCHAPAQENTPLRPRSYHGAGKASAEHFIQAWVSQFNGSAIILRPSNVYGPGQLPKPGFGLIPTTLDHCARRLQMSIWGDGSAIRDYLYVDDLIDLVQRMLLEPSGPGLEVFNASREEGVSVNELLESVERTVGRPVSRVYLPARPGDVSCIVPSSERALGRYSWKATIGLDEGLARTWQWSISPR